MQTSSCAVAFIEPRSPPRSAKIHRDEVPVALDNSASALANALRSFGDELGRALAEGIARGVQEGLSRSLDLDALGEQLPRRAAEGVSGSLQGNRRRGGRPRSEARNCRVSGCTDPARSRGLCSRHYQQELRREKAGAVPTREQAPALPVEARPPIVRKRNEVEASGLPSAHPSHQAPFAMSVPDAGISIAEDRPSPGDLAERIFGGKR